MFRFLAVGFVLLLGLIAFLAAALGSAGWWLVAGVLMALAAVGIYDLVQSRHAILRNYPVLGHMRFAMEAIRPELQQYFIERNYDGRPYDRDTRASIYQRAKGQTEEQPFGTERDVYEPGYEWLVHSTAPVQPPAEPARARIGGPDCRHPYDMALVNVSAMSFGALSGNAIRALNGGAKLGGFAHDTGEGGLSPYHEQGGDLVWEIGTGYFGCRTEDGGFDEDSFREKAAKDQVKMTSLKLSQGAKPGIGGVLPGPKVTQEIADTRQVEVGKTVISPASHRVFDTPRGLVRFLGRMRELSDGKPVGFKLCVGSRADVLAICKAIREEGIAPDFIIVDGSEGGTGAAPMEYTDHIGMPLTEGLMTMHSALVGTGLRDQIALGASGKVATASDLIKRLIQGADFTNSARSMMMAVGCIQAQSCHTNRCPVGVATQDPRRARALDVEDKTHRVARYQKAVVDQAGQMMASMGVSHPSQLRLDMLRRRMDHATTLSYADLFDHLQPGELLSDPPRGWKADWERADPDSFAV